MTLEEYLAFEERSPLRHEYVAGEVYAMSGTTTRHNLIGLNVYRRLHAVARPRGCHVFDEAVTLYIHDRVYHPDLIVACGRAAGVESIGREPSLVVEVTSPSTRATDRREKLELCLRVPSLRMYLVIDQRRRHVLAYTRRADGEWARDEFAGDGEIPFAFLQARLSLDEIYEDVTLPPRRVGEGDEWEEEEEEEEAWGDER